MKKINIPVDEVAKALRMRWGIFVNIKNLRYKVSYINPNHYRFRIERKNSSEWCEFDAEKHVFYSIGTYTDNDQLFFESD